MQDLIEKTGLKSPELGATAIEAEPSCTYDKIRIPRETAENGQILDPCICRLTSMAIHRTLEHMGGGKGFPPWLNMGGSMTPFDICDQCLHQEHHVEESTQQRCKTKIGLVWCGTVMYFYVTAQGGYRYDAVFKDMGSVQLETFMMTEKSDLTDDFRTMVQKLRNDARFSAWIGNTSISDTKQECGMFSHVDLNINKDWNTADATLINMLTEKGVKIIDSKRDCIGNHGTNDMNEETIQYVKLVMKRVMQKTSLPPKFWPQTLDAVTLLMNHLPNARNKSQNENVIRPIEALSARIVSKL
jgi:hypothetical protein